MSKFLARWWPAAGAAVESDAAPAVAAAQAVVPSGSVATPWSPHRAVNGMVGEFLREDEVSTEKLLALFRQAFIPVEVQPHGTQPYLLVQEAGIKIAVRLMPAQRLVTLHAMFGLREDASAEDQLAMCQRVHQTLILVRCYTMGEHGLVFEHSILADGGVATGSLVAAVRRLASITRDALADPRHNALLG